MKITAVDVFPLQGAASQGHYGTPTTTIVRLRTDEGITGYGETDSSPSIVKAIIEAPHHHEHLSGLAKLALGQDPCEPEPLWARMLSGTIYCGRGGPVSHAMAAIDMAAWDIHGKVSGRPVHSFLGPQRHEKVRAYATHPLCATIDESADEARRLVDAGFTAVKFGWRPFGESAEQDESIVRALRNAVGADVDLLIDCGNAFDVEQALERVDRLAVHDIYWLEEPLKTENVAGYARLVEAGVAMPIAAGEQCSTVAELEKFVEAGVKIVQVDIGRVGITPAIEFIRFAEARGVTCVNHTYTLDVALAASLHLAAVIKDPLLLEYPAMPNDLRAILATRVALTEGVARVPESPGLGIDINEARLAELA